MRRFPLLSSLIATPLLLVFVLLSPAHSVTLPEADRSVDNILSHPVEPVLAETLSFVVQAGDVLIVNLPKTLGASTVGAYTTRHAPAMSWLVDHAFFWKTLGKDVGRHYIVFNALVDDLPLDQVTVEIEIR